jgi:hypothetical protein
MIRVVEGFITFSHHHQACTQGNSQTECSPQWSCTSPQAQLGGYAEAEPQLQGLGEAKGLWVCGVYGVQGLLGGGGAQGAAQFSLIAL